MGHCMKIDIILLASSLQSKLFLTGNARVENAVPLYCYIGGKEVSVQIMQIL